MSTDLTSRFAELAELPALVKELRREVEALKAEVERVKTDAGEDFLNVHAAAKFLGMTSAALRQAVYRGGFQAVRVGRRLRFRRRDLLAGVVCSKSKVSER